MDGRPEYSQRRVKIGPLTDKVDKRRGKVQIVGRNKRDARNATVEINSYPRILDLHIRDV